jgi:uncharacterized protein YndB with AHSA1/START domain
MPELVDPQLRPPAPGVGIAPRLGGLAAFPAGDGAFIWATRVGDGMSKIPSIEKVYYYAAPREKVFAALTEPKQLTKWFLGKATLAPRKGGTFRFTWREGGPTLRGKVKEFDPPKRLHLEWNDRFEGGKLYPTEARFSLARKGRGTELRLSHRGFKSGKKWTWLYGAINSGWSYYLLNLRSVLEHRTDLRSVKDEVT